MIFIFLIISFIFNTLLSANNYWLNKDVSNLAVVVVPVANATPFPLSKCKIPENKKDQAYHEFPHAPKIGTYSCLRLHQLLFNEIVKIKKFVKNEIQIELPSLFYINENGKASNNFWILKQNIRPLKDLRKLDLDIIPPEFIYNNQINKDNILTLKFPWQDNITNLNYSAGTRFVRNKQKDTHDKLAIFLIDPKKFKKIETFVPKQLAVTDYFDKKNDCIKSFVDLLKEWAKSKSIPYVWGGASFSHQIKNDKFQEIFDNHIDNNTIFYIRPEMPKPYTGFECSSLILRAAQIMGLPYFCKNTEAIRKTLKPLNINEKLEEGDLIWYKGHIQIVSNLKENKIIESVGYQYGYGIVHEIEISKVFEGIKNYNMLIKAYREKSNIKRLDRNQKPIRTIEQFLILKIASIWTISEKIAQPSLV